MSSSKSKSHKPRPLSPSQEQSSSRNKTNSSSTPIIVQRFYLITNENTYWTLPIKPETTAFDISKVIAAKLEIDIREQNIVILETKYEGNIRWERQLEADEKVLELQDKWVPKKNKERFMVKREKVFIDTMNHVAVFNSNKKYDSNEGPFSSSLLQIPDKHPIEHHTLEELQSRLADCELQLRSEKMLRISAEDTKTKALEDLSKVKSKLKFYEGEIAGLNQDVKLGEMEKERMKDQSYLAYELHNTRDQLKETQAKLLEAKKRIEQLDDEKNELLKELADTTNRNTINNRLDILYGNSNSPLFDEFNISRRLRTPDSNGSQYGSPPRSPLYFGTPAGKPSIPLPSPSRLTPSSILSTSPIPPTSPLGDHQFQRIHQARERALEESKRKLHEEMEQSRTKRGVMLTESQILLSHELDSIQQKSDVSKKRFEESLQISRKRFEQELDFLGRKQQASENEMKTGDI